ncbi:MAG: recombinase family protein [Bradyrhizobiaceae bacterium PARB1]|nr:MAG: recombinase family protein [Bradyrhizobiaceae bacterium PARB1]
MQLIENRAVQYVRMSTDMQESSIAIQAEAIAQFAARHGLTIVRSYEDAGRSGLTLDRRTALQRLIADVWSGYADFKTILIYDVSRWGRFQDTDESAHYEYICRSHGVAVEYCAESFINDGSLSSSIIKALKRAMAGEFSRELSSKVFLGQSRVVANGFRIGSTPGYGLRRVLVDGNGAYKSDLKTGQRIAIQGDHTILVPGPKSEITVIRRIYDLYIDERLSYTAIARLLNSEGIRNAASRDWTYQNVRDVLTNEKYIGNSVYNRASKKMARNWHRNPRRLWIVKEGAYTPLVSAGRFQAAAEIIRKDVHQYQTNFMLDFLAAQWCKHGRLSKEELLGCTLGPSNTTYRTRFGTLTRALELIGYPVRTKWDIVLATRRQIRGHLTQLIENERSPVQELPRNHFLLVNGSIRIGVGLGRSAKKESGGNLWQFGYRSVEKPDFLVVARLAEREEILDYYVLPFALLPKGTWVTLSGRNYDRLGSFRFTSLEEFARLFSRTSDPELLQVAMEARPVGIIERANRVFSDALRTSRFRDLCERAGVSSYPRLPASFNGDSSLVFVIVWRFISSLCEEPNIVHRLRAEWPTVVKLVETAFNFELERGPFPKSFCPTGRPPKRPTAEERAALSAQGVQRGN